VNVENCFDTLHRRGHPLIQTAARSSRGAPRHQFDIGTGEALSAAWDGASREFSARFEPQSRRAAASSPRTDRFTVINRYEAAPKQLVISDALPPLTPRVGRLFRDDGALAAHHSSPRRLRRPAAPFHRRHGALVQVASETRAPLARRKFPAARVEDSSVKRPETQEAPMSLLALTRRHAQRDLLMNVCRCGGRVRLVLPAAGKSGGTTDTRILDSLPDSIWLEYSEQAPPPQAGRNAEIFFSHEGRRYGFRTCVRGARRRIFPGVGERSAIELGMPARIDLRQQREHLRVSLAACGDVHARMTAVLGERRLECRLLNISCGGLASLAPTPAVEPLAIGETHWAEFDLPGDGVPLEFTVRLAHRRPINGGRTIVGWAFCGGEDGSAQRDKVERVRRFVTQRQRDLMREAMDDPTGHPAYAGCAHETAGASADDC
jgi:c-di-GMP-binding flagellar brake protein YcgR